jgi:two-component system, sensor histidine kinase ChiS
MNWLKKKAIFTMLLPIIILVLVFLLFVGVLKQSDTKTKQPIPHQGILDLSGWNASQTENINLNGIWEFYWQKLLTFDAFQNSVQTAEPDG